MSASIRYGYPLAMLVLNSALVDAYAAYNARANEDDALPIEQSAQPCLLARYINILKFS